MEGRLAAATVLRRTKTSGPNRVKELPVAISEHGLLAELPDPSSLR